MVLPLKRKLVKQVAIGDGFMIMLGKDFLVNGSQEENTQESVMLIKPSDQKFECQRQLNYGSDRQGDESFTQIEEGPIKPLISGQSPID